MPSEPRKGKRLTGHTLWNGGYGGTACNQDGFDLVNSTGWGYAFCECGTRSAELAGEAERKSWHLRHQYAIRKEQANG